MLADSLKFISLCVFFNSIILFFYSFVSYELIVKNIYINSYILAFIFVFIFIFVCLTGIRFCFLRVFQEQKNTRFLFLAEMFIPILVFSFGLGYLSNIYHEFNSINYQVVKTGKFVAKNVASLNGTEEEISAQVKFLMDDVLNKQHINTKNISYSVKFPTQTTNYGDNFIIEVEDKRNFNILRESTLMPFPKKYTWRFFYNFMNNTGSAGSGRVLNQVSYSTPYEDFAN